VTAFLLFAAKAALGLSLFYAVYALGLRNETHFRLNRAYLVGALVLSFLIPAFPVTSPFRTVPSVLDLASLPSGPLPVRGLGLLDVLAAVYAVGALAFLLRFALQLARLAAVVRRGGIHRRGGSRIVAVGESFAPFSFLGFVFINEQGLEPGDLSRILAHERVHIRQLHSLDLLATELAVIVLWFNPLVGAFKKSLQETHEYLADAGVIAQGFGGAGYRRLVFEQHVGARLFGVGNSFKQSQIKRRLSMMSKNPSAGCSRWKCLLAIPAALALIALFAVPQLASSATPAGQDKPGPAAVNKVSQEKAAQAIDELNKLSQMEAELKAAYKGAADEAARVEIKAKLEKKLQGLKKKAMALQAAGGTPVMVKKTALPPLEEIKAKLQTLQEKETDVRASLDKADSPEKRNELKKSLQMILEKQEQLKQMAVEAQAKEAKAGK
jgi:hypothetical protein